MKNLILFVYIVLVPAGNAQELQSYIEEAQANNPEVQAYELRYDIAREQVNEAGWLPNTELGAGYFVSEPETRTGAQKARFTVRQMLPWFGTVSKRKEYAGAMAETDYMDYMIARRKLALEVSRSYYTLYGLQAGQAVLEENIRLLENYEALALTAVEVGNASAVDVLRLQIRRNELQQQRQILGEKYLAEQAKFNSLLNREADLPITVAGHMYLPQQDPVLEDSLVLNPELLRFDKLYASVMQAELVNQSESAPMFGVGVDYIPVEKRPDMTFSDNGKDVLMPMVSLSVPIFDPRYASRSRQNEMRRQELTYQKRERQNVLEAALAEAVSRRNQARIAFSTQEDNLRQARDAEQILVRSYETGTIDFRDVLDIQELQLSFQMEQISSVQQYYIQSAIINYLINF